METLLIPLYGRALMSEKFKSVLDDFKAREIVSKAQFDFEHLKIEHKTQVMLTIRAVIIDSYTNKFIEEHKDCTVIHLGCGLDSRALRVKKEYAKWYDIDFPEVIEYRKMYYSESEEYRMLPSSVTDLRWIEKTIPTANDVLIIAEGLMMYLSQEEVNALINAMSSSFPQSPIHI